MAQPKLQARVTQALARRIVEASEPVPFPKEADLCLEFGVSRTVLRESMKVLVDKGMVEMKPRAGTRSTPRSEWRRLDPDILAWQAEAQPDARFLRDLCEVRLAIEPTAAGFAAIRATSAELRTIEKSLRDREEHARAATPDRSIELDLDFQTAVVAASHNPLLLELCDTIRQPFRTALAWTSRFPSAVQLRLEAHHVLFDALRRHDPMGARRAAEEVVGLAMIAVEKAVKHR